MANLTIHLQDGFSNDQVVIRVNDRVVFEKSGVSTKRLLGLADKISVPVPDEGGAKVQIAVPSRKVETDFTVEPAPKNHVGVLLKDDKLQHFVSQRAFAYA
jgi:hypothetical protein